MFRIQKFMFAVILFCAWPGTLFAGPVKNAHTQVELVAEAAAVQPGRPFWAGLRMDMDDGWQTYWKNPGDSGLATAVQWDLPQGFKAGELHWPFPIRMDYPELTSYGYEGEVFLFSEITPPEDLAAGSRQTIKARVTWLACGNICVPGKADLSLELPVQHESPPMDEHIREAFALTMINWPLAESGWDITAYDAEGFFRLRLRPPPGRDAVLTQAAFFPERGNLIDHAARQTLEKIENGYALVIPKSSVTGGQTARLKGVLVSGEGWQEGGRRALSMDVPVHAQSSANR